MPVPKYYEMQRPFLEALKDGKPHAMKNIVDFIIGYFHLSTEDIAEMLPSGRQNGCTIIAFYPRTITGVESFYQNMTIVFLVNKNTANFFHAQHEFFHRRIWIISPNDFEFTFSYRCASFW